MVRFTALACLAALTASVAACDRAPDKAPAPAAPQSAAAPAPVPPLSRDEAFRLAFGASGEAVRKVTRDRFEETLTYKPDRMITVGEHPVLVSTAVNASDCHACSGALAVHYFVHENGAWRVSAAFPEIVPGQGWGAPPEWRVRTDLGVPQMLVAEAGWTGQGYTCTSVDLIELGAGGAVVRADNLPVHMDNQGVVGDEPGLEVANGSLGRGPDGKLRVTFTGTKTGFTDYALKNGRYVPVGGDQTLGAC